MWNILGAPMFLGVMRSCQLPASWSGNLTAGTINVGQRFSMYDCDAIVATYKLWIEDYAGTIKDETTIVRTAGATDGVTSLSWKMAANANPVFLINALASDEFVIWNDNVAASRTLTVDYLHDTNVAAGQGSGASSAFQNNEVWLEVQYPSSTSSPQYSRVTSAPDAITAASDNPIGVGTSGWTTTGLTTPKSGSVSVTFTPQQRGFLLCKVFVAKASKTVYVDPAPVVA